ncbi:hypothetical protein RHIZO_04851 [Rhizobiaceae bacterium]|nr:hypothetical protein RHIZO_04851 [Rhizobiaceae bacterium]
MGTAGAEKEAVHLRGAVLRPIRSASLFALVFRVQKRPGFGASILPEALSQKRRHCTFNWQPV